MVPKAVFSSIRSYFMTHYAHLPTLNKEVNVLDQAYALTKNPSSEWPTIEYYFDGYYISVPPSVYFLETTSKGRSAWMFGIASMDISVEVGMCVHE